MQRFISSIFSKTVGLKCFHEVKRNLSTKGGNLSLMVIEKRFPDILLKNIAKLSECRKSETFHMVNLSDIFLLLVYYIWAYRLYSLIMQALQYSFQDLIRVLNTNSGGSMHYVSLEDFQTPNSMLWHTFAIAKNAKH